MAEIWCPDCCTSHSHKDTCPGDLEATGSERRGWKTLAGTPHGVEAYGVLLAEVGEQWRARIMTFPNVLWAIPGGQRSLKFLAGTEREAEQMAVEFIRTHCREKGYSTGNEPDVVDPGRRPVSATIPARVLVDDPDASKRFERRLPVRFGEDRPSVLATTYNLSVRGLFVKTRKPLEEGQTCGMILEMEHCKLPLRGAVMWRRPTDESSARPAGMGLRLLDAPVMYKRYVQALA